MFLFTRGLDEVTVDPHIGVGQEVFPTGAVMEAPGLTEVVIANHTEEDGDLGAINRPCRFSYRFYLKS